MKLKKLLVIAAAIIAIVVLVFGILLYKQIFSKNTRFSEKEIEIFVPTDANYAQILTLVKPYIKDLSKFEWVASKKSYPEHVKSGRFIFKKDMNSNELVNALRQNIAVDLAFNNQERLEDFAGRIGAQIEADSLSLLKSFNDPVFLEQHHFSQETILCMFLPNSYEIFWNTSADKFRDKMLAEYESFWNKERLKKADLLGLTPIEVIILASIVHKETNKNSERPRVAGVYINRLNTGMALGADPTIIFAKKKKEHDFDQVIKRVLYDDLKLDSPYNTYTNIGLPPGPIAMPDITAIDAVLNYEKHHYLYFCASVIRFGYHEFAENLNQHAANRNKYVAWVNTKGIKR